MAWEDKPQPFDESSDAAAFAHGAFDGFMHHSPRPNKYESARRDPYYYKFAYVMFWMAKVGVLVLAAKYGLGL